MFYLIDFENVSNSGMNGIQFLDQNDTIIIFYSQNANKINMDIHIELEKTKAKKEYIEVKTSTKNAMDFQLSTYLGALVTENPKEDFAIISKDEGFKSVVDFWKNKGKKLDIFNDLNKNIVAKISEIEEIPLSEQVEKLLVQYPDKASNVSEIIGKYKTKQGINNALVKEYKSEVAGIIYKLIKPVLKDKK